jgi:transcription termination factor Rho
MNNFNYLKKEIIMEKLNTNLKEGQVGVFIAGPKQGKTKFLMQQAEKAARIESNSISIRKHGRRYYASCL